MVRSHFQLQKLTQRCILLTFYRYFLQFDGNQSMRARLWWMELLSGCRQQHRCCIRKKWVSYIDIQKTGTSLQLPLTFFSIPTAFPAISGGSKSVGEVWVAGAAAMLTAAAVPSREFQNPNARRMWCTTGDGHEHDGCSGGGNAVDDGRRGGR